MTKADGGKILAILNAAYPTYYKDLGKEEAHGVVSLWTMQFAAVPVEVVLMALNKAICTCKYPPTIAEMRKNLSSIYWESYMHFNIESKKEGGNPAPYSRLMNCTANYGSSEELSTSDMLKSSQMLLE